MFRMGVGCAVLVSIGLLFACAPSSVDEKKKAAQGASPSDQAALQKEAEDAVRVVSQLVAVGQIDAAKAKMRSFGNKFVGTKPGLRLGQLARELAVVGKDAPAEWPIEKWFQGQDAIELDGKGTTLVVFWEVWCGHCQREVPKLQAVYDKFKGDGLKLIGVTRVNQGATEQSVTEFIAQNHVQYPIAKVDNALAQYFAVSGIPAAAVIKDGKVVWRGNPHGINDEMVRGWLTS